MHKQLAATLSLPVALLALAGCSSSSTSDSSSTSTTTTSSTASVAPTPSATTSTTAPDGASATPSAVPTVAGSTVATSAVPSAAPSSSASATAVTSMATSSTKFATAKLPSKIDGYSGAVQKQGAGQSGMYTGATQDDMLMVQLNPIAATGALTRLTNTQTVGAAQCGGSSDAAGVMTCVVALDGGSLVVQGTDTSTAAQLGKATNDILKALG